MLVETFAEVSVYVFTSPLVLWRVAPSMFVLLPLRHLQLLLFFASLPCPLAWLNTVELYQTHTNIHTHRHISATRLSLLLLATCHPPTCPLPRRRTRDRNTCASRFWPHFILRAKLKNTHAESSARPNQGIFTTLTVILSSPHLNQWPWRCHFNLFIKSPEKIYQQENIFNYPALTD